jgi:hypothetical protein
MRNVPPGIHRMPGSGGGPGGPRDAVCSTVPTFANATPLSCVYGVRTTPGRLSDQITQMAIAIISSDQNG